MKKKNNKYYTNNDIDTMINNYLINSANTSNKNCSSKENCKKRIAALKIKLDALIDSYESTYHNKEDILNKLAACAFLLSNNMHKLNNNY